MKYYDHGAVLSMIIMMQGLANLHNKCQLKITD